MVTKCNLFAVVALAFSALAVHDSPASSVAAKEVAEAFGETLKEKQPLLKNAMFHKSADMASKDDLVVKRNIFERHGSNTLYFRMNLEDRGTILFLPFL